MLEDFFSLKSILKTAAAKNDNKAEDGEKLDNALPPTETTPPTDIVQQPANQLQVQTPTDLAVPATTETAPIAPQQPPAGKKSISIKEEKSYSGGLWNTLVLNIPDMTAQVSKSLRDLALRRISALTAQNRGRPPSWAVFKNEVAPWKLWNDIQYKTKTYTITTTENEFFRAAVEKLRQTNFDVSALEPYAQGTAAEQTEQQTDKGPISYSIEIVRNPKDQKFARWDYLLLRVKQSNRKIPDLALLESFKEEIKKNFSIDANNPPGTVVWNSAESAYVLFRVLPSKIQQLAEGLKVKNFKVDQLLEAMRAYKTQLEESNEQLTDPRKTLQVENVSANTKFLFAIRFPAARDLQTELSEYIKFSFPSKGNLTDLQRVPVAEGQAAQPDANKPNGMRLEKDYRWYLHGSFDDIYKFSALIKKLGWNVDSLRLVLGNLLTSGALERTRYTGALDGYELMETDAATGVTKQKRDKKNNPMFRYEDFYEDIDKTVKKGISVYDGQKDGIRWLYERNCCILGDKTGTGKTLETLAAAKMRLAQDGGKCLIFTLKSTQTQLSWALTKLLGEDPASVVVCAPRFDELTEAGYIVDSTLSEESMANAKWVVLSYSNLQATPNYDPITKQMILDQNGVPTFKARDRKKKVIMESLLKTQFTCVIMDESHTLKSGATGKGDLIAMLTPKIPFRWAASATAVANTPKDLHPILQLIGHTLGEMSSRDFNKEFVGEKMTIKDAKEDGFEQKLKETEERASKLRKWLLLSGAYISRSQKSIRPDLPSHKKRALFLEEEGFDMQAFFNDVREKIATYGNKAAAVVSLTAQRVKLADMKVPKSIAAAKKLIDKGHKVLLFSNFVRPCRIMYNELNAYLKTLDPDFYAVSIMQGDHVENIDKSIADFKNADSAARVMIISAKKGGTGISLENSCSYVIMNDYDWSPSTAEQTEGRAFRITNDIPVRTLYMVIRGKDGKLNPDEVFFNLVQGKIKIANKIQDLGAEAEETHMAGLNDAPIRAKMIKAREEEIDIERRYREQWNEMAHQYGADDVAFDDKDDEVDMGDEMSEAAQEFEDNGIDLDAQGESLTKDDQAFLNLGNEEDDEDSDRAKNASWYGIVKSITPV